MFHRIGVVPIMQLVLKVTGTDWKSEATGVTEFLALILIFIIEENKEM